MKKNTHFALTITAVSLLHIAGLWAMSNFDDKPAELAAPQEELTFVDLGGGAPAPAPAPLPVAQAKPEPKRERKPEPDVKRTIVKKPQEKTVVERKPEPKPEQKPESKPEPERKPEQKPEKSNQRQQSANNQSSAQQSDNKGNAAQGTGTNANNNGKGGDNNKGGNDGKGSGGGSGPSSNVKIAGSANCLSPEYPQEALDRGETGVVRVRWVVGADGRINSVEVVGSSGSSRLDKAAKRKAATCKFKPAVKNGVPVQDSFAASYRFNIKQ